MAGQVQPGAQAGVERHPDDRLVAVIAEGLD
jgi:hypothetical protein